MKTYLLDKQTAKLIAQTRRAQNTIDKIELRETHEREYGSRRFTYLKDTVPDSPNIAYLKNGVMLPPFRCDIVEKWAQLDVQQIKWTKPESDVQVIFADNGEVTLSRGQSSVKLYAIDQRNEPAIHPLPIIFDGDRIKLDFDPKQIIEKAKLLTSSAARNKKDAKAKAEAKRIATIRAEYERCAAIVTPEAIKATVKRVRRLRKLQSWLRKVETEVSYVPSLPQLRSNPLFNAFDHNCEVAYGDARLKWIEATNALRDYKPRSWRAPGREKKQEAVKIAFCNVSRIIQDALQPHVKSCGFNLWGFGASDHTEYNTNDVRRCRKFMRDHKRDYEESVASHLSTVDANTVTLLNPNPLP